MDSRHHKRLVNIGKLIYMIVLSFFSDVGDLQNFVNVSLATSAGGEDDLSKDRLSNLRTVGSGFSSLVYGMKEDTDFDTLSYKCLPVWTACKKNKSLPKMLVCARLGNHIICGSFFMVNLNAPDHSPFTIVICSHL